MGRPHYTLLGEVRMLRRCNERASELVLEIAADDAQPRVYPYSYGMRPVRRLSSRDVF